MRRGAHRSWLAAVATIVGMAACSHDWDALDPRVGEAGASTAASTGVTTGAGASSSTGPGGTTTGATSSGSGAAGGGTGAATTSSGTSGAGGGTSGAGGGTGGVGGGTTGAGGATTGSLSYAASVADCVDLMAPDPDACEAYTGAGQMSVDLLEAMTGFPNASFLRFDLDDALAGATITGVTLRLVVTTDANAFGDEAGEIWEVAPFARPDLFTAVPAKVGNTSLAPSVGAVALGDTVDWTLPPTVVVAGGSVYLGIFPISENGVSYWNLNGTTPPALIVDYQ